MVDHGRKWCSACLKNLLARPIYSVYFCPIIGRGLYFSCDFFVFDLFIFLIFFFDFFFIYICRQSSESACMQNNLKLDFNAARQTCLMPSTSLIVNVLLLTFLIATNR